MSFADMLYIVVSIPVAAFMILLAYTILSAFNASSSEIATVTIPGQNQTVIQQGMSSIGLFDSLLFLAIMGVSLVAIIAASMINIHPAFAFISIFILGAVVLVSSVFSNMYEEFTANSFISTASTAFPITNFVMSKLPLIMLILSIIIAVVMYGKPTLSGRTNEY